MVKNLSVALSENFNMFSNLVAIIHDFSTERVLPLIVMPNFFIQLVC